MITHRFITALTAALVVFWAGADTITVGDTTYTDVYIGQGSTMYYVSIPEDGTVLNVPIEEASGVEITEDQAARTALFREWQKNNHERRGLPQPAPRKAQMDTAEAGGSPQRSRKIISVKRGVDKRGHRLLRSW